ncbi:MAG: hypothetical protein NTZ73_00540 [Candidatus Diapherotrites archaeon]|nr:hypothetical protein [Candidatus Diapherotrites archaeon]
MFDPKYDEPNYNPGGGYYGDDQPQGNSISVGPVVNLLKKYKMLIIVGVIGIIAIALIMNWLNSNQDVTITVRELDTGTKIISNISVKDESGTKTIKTFAAQDSATINLPYGKYLLTVSSTSTGTYNTITNEPLIVPIDSTDLVKKTKSIILHRDRTADVKIYMDVLDLYGTRDINGTVEITNTGKKDIVNTNLKVVNEDASINEGDLEVNFAEQGNKFPLTVYQGSSQSVAFTVKMNKAVSAEKKVKLMVKLEGMEASTESGKNGAEKELTANPASTLTVTTSNAVSARALEKKTIDVKISNTGKYDADEISVELVAQPGSEGMIDWFRFISPASGKNTLQIVDSLAKGKNTGKAVQLYFNPPVEAEQGDEFFGTIIVSSPSIASSIEVGVKYTVSESVKRTITLNGISSPVEVKFDSKENKYNILDKKDITLKNTGNVDVENVVFALDAGGQTNFSCANWVKILEADPTTGELTFSEIVKGGSSIPFTIRIEIDSEATENDPGVCHFYWSGNIKGELSEFVGGDAVITIIPRD